MSQRKIKVKPSKQAPLDWIRTDNDSMFECFYILLLTRGLHNVLDCLKDTLSYEAEASRDQKAPYSLEWLREAEFCDDAIAQIEKLQKLLLHKWSKDDPMMARRKDPVIGGLYPLPWGGVYIPKR